MMKDNTNSGFSLIELIIAMTILLVLSGMIFLGSDSARRKETEKYAAALGNEILMARTASMSKAGKWRLGLYLKEKEYYCILESEEKASGESGGVYWESRSEKVRLGHAGAVDYEWERFRRRRNRRGQPGEGEADSCMAVRPRYRLLHGGSGHS